MKKKSLGQRIEDAHAQKQINAATKPKAIYTCSCGWQGTASDARIIDKEVYPVMKKMRTCPTCTRPLGMAATPTQYLKDVYGLELNDLDLVKGQFDIPEVERLAKKYGLTKREKMTVAMAKAVLKPFMK